MGYFLWEEKNTQLKRISLTADGKERNQGEESANRIVVPSISGNGRYIAFATTASNMVPDDDKNFQDVFIYDTQTNTTIIASTTADGKFGNADSPNENFEFGAGQMYKWDLGVASGFVGNIKFQSVKSTGRFTVVNNWQVKFSDLEGKPKTYNIYFSRIKGLRILWLDDRGFAKVE